MTTAMISGHPLPRPAQPLIIDIASPEAQLEQLASERLRQKLIAHACPTSPLADAKQTFLLRDEHGRERAVAQLSSRAAPDMVRRGIERAAAIRAQLSDATAEPILPALASGELQGLSFGIWRHCTSVSRPGASWFARRWLVGPVLEWLRSVLRETSRPVPQQTIDGVLGPRLCAMATDRRLSATSRLAARSALLRLDRGSFRPMTVAMHGDVHLGNLLIDPARAGVRDDQPWPQCFTLIDWCGASPTGFPLYDLLRVADSLRVPQPLLAREIAAHCTALDADPDDAEAHVVSALAELRANLEYFPLERYRVLADRLIDRVHSAHAADQRVAS